MELAKSEPIRKSDLELAPNLKAIGTYSAGVNRLPLQAYQERGTRILITPVVLYGYQGGFGIDTAAGSYAKGR
jgi:phosphoglycerate dehydrogenase-like enzyme